MSRFAQRRRKLRAELKRQGITAMLVTDELNVTYLSGSAGTQLSASPSEEHHHHQ